METNQRVIDFRQTIEEQMSKFRFKIGNVSSDTTISQRKNLFGEFKGMEFHLLNEMKLFNFKALRNEQRLNKIITDQARERYSQHLSVHRYLAKVTKTYLIKVKHLSISLSNQCDKYPVDASTKSTTNGKYHD